jgi:hypothetical protein
MYACILETGRGFFEGVCPPSDATAHSRDPPPPPLNSRSVSLFASTASGASRRSESLFAAQISCALQEGAG